MDSIYLRAFGLPVSLPAFSDAADLFTAPSGPRFLCFLNRFHHILNFLLIKRKKVDSSQYPRRQFWVSQVIEDISAFSSFDDQPVRSEDGELLRNS